MSVYVDNARNKYGRMFMSHMMADTLEELHTMALEIGVAQKHFQDGKRPHYDICQRMKVRAVLKGAKQITSRQMIERFRRTP